MNDLVFLDTDFLSAFLKINRIELVRNFYHTAQFFISTSVRKEVAQSDLLPQLAMLSWIEVQIPPPDSLRMLRQNDQFERLGAGEQELI